MKKASKHDGMLPEYDFSGGVRGKYAKRYHQGSNIVVLDPDVTKRFPDSVAENPLAQPRRVRHRMLQNFTAAYTRIPSGYMGQIVEWPEIITEGKDLEACRESLRDALTEMIAAYRELGKEIPCHNSLIEHLPVEA